MSRKLTDLDLANVLLKDKDHQIAVLEKALELVCDWFKQTGFIGDQTAVDYFKQQAEREIGGI